MLKVGLTGGIGCGKSVVAGCFADLGVTVTDTDVIARELLFPNTPAYLAVLQHFGDSILTAAKTIDRAVLRDIIFSNYNERRWLEQLLHPLIYTEVCNRLKHLTGRYCIIVIPLLIETNWIDIVDRILAVDCQSTTQIKRIVSRDNCTEEFARVIIKAQASRKRRLALADDVINNDTDLGTLRNRVLQLHKYYLMLANV